MTHEPLVAGIKGLYLFEAVRLDEEGNEISRRALTGWVPNLITNAGLNGIGANALYLLSYYCRVGSGSTAPAFTDTALAAHVAGVAQLSDSQGQLTAAPWYAWRRIVYRFAAGVAAGNLSEVGTATTINSGGILFSRALILDSNGNPTTITILSDEVLDVTYELRCYPPTVDVPHSTVIGGVTHTGTLRTCGQSTGVQVPNWSTAPSSSGVSALGNNQLGTSGAGVKVAAINAVPASLSYYGQGITPTLSAYVADSYYRDITIQWTLTMGNQAGGIGAMVIGTWLGALQVDFEPAIPKDATKTLTMSFRVSWARQP